MFEKAVLEGVLMETNWPLQRRCRGGAETKIFQDRRSFGVKNKFTDIEISTCEDPNRPLDDEIGAI